MSEFGSLDLEEVQGEKSRLETKGQGGFLDQFVPMPEVKQGESGEVIVRILPPVKGGKLFQYNRIHTVNGRKIHCPRPLVNGKWDRNVDCPICDYYNSLWRSADKAEERGDKDAAEAFKKEARSIKPVERYYYNALVRSMTVDGTSTLNVGPRVLSVGKILHQMIIRAIVSDKPQEKLGDITNIETGFDFIITKELRSDFPNYDRSNFARECSPLGDKDLVKHVVANMHDLTKFRNLKDVEALKKELAIHRGLIPDDAETFNVDKFDAEYRNTSSASVPADVTSEPTTTSEVATDDTHTDTPAETPTTTDTVVESDDFLKDLAEFQQDN